MIQSIETVRSLPRSRPALAVLLAAVAAPLALSAAASSADAGVSIHLKTSKLSLWITLIPHYSSVSPAGDAAHITSSTGAPSGMDMIMADLPDFQGLPTAPMMTSDVDMVMASVDMGPGFGSPVSSSANWGIWVTGRNWGVHIIWHSAELLRAGMEPGGTHIYRIPPGTQIPAQVEYTDPNGISSFENQFIDELEFSAPFPLPTPGAAALLGLGGLVAMRRRRP